MLTLADIFEALSGVRPQAASLVISEAAVDSRQLIPGSLFVALKGERSDGHEYVQAAFERGAHLALIQREVNVDCPVVDLRGLHLKDDLDVPATPFCVRVEDTLQSLQKLAAYWRRKHDLRVIGITGSVGKTTTKELIAEVLAQRYRVLKTQGNWNNEIGLPLTLLRLTAAHQAAVLEMGFYVPGEIAFLCEIAQPQVGVITSIGTVHAERAGSQEAIARGKSELVQALPPAPAGVAILNWDDPWVRWMADKTRAQLFTYGLDASADLRADQIEGLGLKGIRFRLHFRNDTIHLRVPIIGRHSVHTILRAVAVGLVAGVSWQEIIYALQHSQSQLRMVTVNLNNGAMILDDSYNAAPESTLAALNLLSEIKGRKIAVLGDMLELGMYEKEGHEKVGVRAAEVADTLIAVGRLARMIAESARKSGLPAEKIYIVDGVGEATDLLRGMLREGDVALVKGSHGLRMDRIVAALEAES
ncbi:MAG: UDP-N-acetylmuramoyl-tripeptide--D-alanyl-D-alanine ligase [Bellilinea sp.]|nr:MAG: UDP-N-acetylmuramoyl-tripeptide--D-alanyl-D-alanine ligase [Bellilinea sp.]